MTSHVGATLALTLSLGLAASIVGCANSGGGTVPRLDANAGQDASVDAFSGLDAPGIDTGRPPCGDVGEACCGAAHTCSSNRRCETDVCCAVPGGGVACTTPDDCCGGGDCVGGTCCSLQGSACRTSEECCSELLCQGGTCTLPPEACGHPGETCCTGEECRSGAVCAGGRCEACGSEGAVCCAAPSECAADLSCQGGHCATPDPTCGGDGQTCCAGDRCTGSLACVAGSCAMPTTECAYLDCNECTSHYPCGWCGDTGTCGVGDSTGPSTGSCGNWAWQTSECTGPTDPCADATTCDTCTARAGCGFCDGACRSGSASGPTGTTCSGAWAWLSSECAAPDDCASHTDCASCTGASSCGWCAGTGTCSAGSSAGPTSGTCSTWSWISDSCPTVDACSDFATCLDCTDAPGGGCGYCATTGECVSGNILGPTTGTCANWDGTSTMCTCSPLAATCTTDATCCGALSCRRGATFGVRCCSESTDTCGTGADCCGYMDCVSGHCACRTAGRGCLDNRDCCSSTCTAGRCA